MDVCITMSLWMLRSCSWSFVGVFLLLLLNCSHLMGEIESMVFVQYRQDNFSRKLNVSVPYFLLLV